MAITYLPIWKDKTVALGSGDYSDFEVRLDSSSGEAIFSGRSYKRPGDNYPVVRINDVCAPYLDPGLGTFATNPGGGGMRANDVSRAFVVLYYSGGSWTEAETVYFYADWSFDYDFALPASLLLGDPVRLLLDRRQLLLQSHAAYVSGENVVTYYKDDGTTFTETLTGVAAPGFGYKNLAAYSANDYVGIKIGTGPKYDVVQGCGPRWAVYYINAYGGWDTVLLTRKAIRTDNLDRHTRVTDYDNSDRSARSRRDYAVEYAAEWEFHTDWLTEDESSRMHHLLNTPEAWLLDLEDVTPGSVGIPPVSHLIPAVLTNTDTPHKTRWSEEGRLIQYTITARVAQEFVRR